MSRGRSVAVIDCQVAGVSGDMVLGALLDLGADVKKVVDAMKSVEGYIEGCRNLEITVKDVARKGIRAKRVEVKAEETHEMGGKKLIEATVNCVRSLKLSEKAEKFALNAISTLVNAEAKVHGESIENVCLHEAGSVDTPAEIVGVAVALENLGFFNLQVYSTPVAVGGGLFKFSHGTFSSPAPATIEILRSKGYPIIGGPVETELATPTGVSILVNLASNVARFYPPMKPTSIGYGAGAKDFAEMPNVLRITVGELGGYQLIRDEIYVLETNVDDVAGEIIGYTIDKLLREGAKDVSVIPMFTKKNRPGHIIKVIADKANVEHLSLVLIEETGTLGVRAYPCERHILNRESILVNVQIGELSETVNVKVAKNGEGKIIQMKPEYEDVKRIADKINKPLRDVMELVKLKAKEILR
ncbi:MAG: nickel pincer cofactor biosynthesis protein LarC [Nitrososphaerota archaeon]|nr:nickel pincer cofactor biosynthesis protein LarC [Candidatus Bathyarchaeota archaeon]MDW8022422.1 nickel pincer cofactor biosynthesis protein LarC [Nitrososphaerota archaeon]